MDKKRSKYEIDNINQKLSDIMKGTEEDFARWLMRDAKKYGVKGRKYR